MLSDARKRETRTGRHVTAPLVDPRVVSLESRRADASSSTCRRGRYRPLNATRNPQRIKHHRQGGDVEQTFAPRSGQHNDGTSKLRD